MLKYLHITAILSVTFLRQHKQETCQFCKWYAWLTKVNSTILPMLNFVSPCPIFLPVFVTCWSHWKPYLWYSRRYHQNQIKRDSIYSISASLTMPFLLHHFLTTIFSVLIASHHQPFHFLIFQPHHYLFAADIQNLKAFMWNHVLKCLRAQNMEQHFLKFPRQYNTYLYTFYTSKSVKINSYSSQEATLK